MSKALASSAPATERGAAAALDEVLVAPALQTEGKQLQRDQAIGMGATSAAAPAPIPTSVADNGGGVATPALVGE